VEVRRADRDARGVKQLHVTLTHSAGVAAAVILEG
jgi:hypothetical protein